MLAPLTTNFAIDLGARDPNALRWTYFNSAYRSHARPDRILASPEAGKLCHGFEVRREGLALDAGDDARPRLPGVGRTRPRASDHALLVVDLATNEAGAGAKDLRNP